MNKHKSRITLTACFMALILLGISLHSVTMHMQPTAQITAQGLELLDESWLAMPGTTSYSSSGLHFRHVGRAVRTLSNQYADNPTALLYGKHIDAKGTVSVRFSVANRSGDANISILHKPPLILDEQVFRYPMLSVSIKNTGYTVSAWSENTTAASFQQSQSAFIGANSTVQIEKSGTSYKIWVDDGTPVVIPSDALPPSTELWFGASAGLQSSWDLLSVYAKTLDGTTASVVDTRDLLIKKNGGGLQSTATAQRNNFTLGAAVSLMPLVTDRSYAQAAFGGDFGMITTENALKMQFIQPQRGVYDFAEADALIALASKHQLRIHGHALVFGEANPAWLANVSAQEVEQVMLDHITTTVGRYKERIYSWDVINEPLADYDAFTANQPLRNHAWHKAMGASYIEKALRAAHAANPNADLWINDFGMEGSVGDTDSERWDAMLALVTQLRQKGVPLSGVGFQSHVYQKGDEILGEVFAARIVQLAQLGLKARVSELDVHNDDGRTAQAEQFKTVTAACYMQSNCDSVTTWGVTDSYGSTGWIENTDFYPGDGLLWDTANKRLPAYDSMKAALSNAGTAINYTPPSNPTSAPVPTLPPAASPSPLPTIKTISTPLPTVAPGIAPTAITTPTLSPRPTITPTAKPTALPLVSPVPTSSVTPRVTPHTSLVQPTPTPTAKPVAPNNPKPAYTQDDSRLQDWWRDRRPHWWRKLFQYISWRFNQ